MEATVFNSQETPSGLFTLRELETEENSDKVASREVLTALSLLAKDWVRSFDDRTQVTGRLRHKYENHYEDIVDRYVLQFHALRRLSIASVA